MTHTHIHCGNGVIQGFSVTPVKHVIIRMHKVCRLLFQPSITQYLTKSLSALFLFGTKVNEHHYCSCMERM